MFLDLLTSDNIKYVESIEPINIIDENDDEILTDDWQLHSDGAFKYPKSFSHEETSQVDNCNMCLVGSECLHKRFF